MGFMLQWIYISGGICPGCICPDTICDLLRVFHINVDSSKIGFEDKLLVAKNCIFLLSNEISSGFKPI